MTINCPNCGAICNLEKGICEKCGATLTLDAYGFTVRRLKRNKFVLLKGEDSEPIHVFSSLTSSLEKKNVAKLTGAPMLVVEKTFAELALTSISPVEEGQKDFTEVVAEKADFDDETVGRAWKLLKNPAFLYLVGKVFECGFMVPKINKPRFIIGEERNKRLLGLLLIGASKLGMTSIVKLLGEPGTAKDTMVRMWLRILDYGLKYVERSYITAASLRYSKEMDSADLLYIPDSPELRGETSRHLRFMRADDGGLISEYAMRDPETGEMTTKIVEIPVKGIVTTSNFVTGDSALESGMWTLITNGSAELTRQVKIEKLRLRAGKRELFPENELKVWQCAFYLLLTRELPDKLPYVPFAENLIQFLESERTESRRDPDKLCDLISVIAWIRRFQKPQEKRGEADIVDLYHALQLGLDAITQTMSELNEKEKAVYEAIKNANEDATCRYVADQTGIPYKTCYRLLERMVDRGYLLKDNKGRRNVYSIFSKKTPKGLSILKGRSFEKPDELIKFILESFPNFSPSRDNGEEIFLIDPITGDAVTCKFNEGKAEVFIEKKLYPYPYEKVRRPKTSPISIVNDEKGSKDFLLSEMRNEKDPDFIFHRLKPAEPCPLCGEHPVEYEINDVRGKQILRRCKKCFQKMHITFVKAVWREIP